MASWTRSNFGNLKDSPLVVSESITREQGLWKAVLSQAVYEACTDWYQGVPLTITEKYQAKNWINMNNPDFMQVCEWAGYEQEYICMKAKQLLARKEEINRKVMAYKQKYKVSSTFATIIGTIS